MTAERTLPWLIRANAAVLLAAVVPAFFPTELMAELHGRFGLGEMVRGRLTEYLTRSAAAGYALHGGVLLALAADVVRYRRLIEWVYVLHLLFAAAVFGIDLYAGMPGWWTAAEAGTIAAVAVVVLAVNRAAKRGGGERRA